MTSLTPDIFWGLVEIARQSREQFREELKLMDRESLIHFCWTYEMAAARFKYEPYVDHFGSESISGIDEIGQWIVGQGKEYCLRILKDPSLLPVDVPDRDPAFGYLSDAVREYYERYGGPLPYPDDDFYELLE